MSAARKAVLSTCAALGHQPGGLNPGAAGRQVRVFNRLTMHGFGLDDQQIRTPPEPRVYGVVKRLSCCCYGKDHVARSSTVCPFVSPAQRTSASAS